MSISDNSVHRCTCGTWCYANRPCTTCHPTTPMNTT